LRACNRARRPSRLGAGAQAGAASQTGAGSHAATAAPLQAALRACKRVNKPSRLGAGAQAGAASQTGAGAGAQQAAAAPLQSFLRPKIPAEALDEVAIAHPTIAKAIINRRIRNSPITKKGIPLPASYTLWLHTLC
jgi:hypothetical protein